MAYCCSQYISAKRTHDSCDEDVYSLAQSVGKSWQARLEDVPRVCMYTTVMDAGDFQFKGVKDPITVCQVGFQDASLVNCV